MNKYIKYISGGMKGVGYILKGINAALFNAAPSVPLI